jgi:dienelactone hydrolase
MRTENTHLAEQLASQGYVVVGIDHPYGSYATVLPDGQVIKSKLLDEDFYSTEASFNRFLKTAETEIRTRADDARFVVDALEELDAAGPTEPFAHRLDLNRVGIFGFSLGGGVAAQTCWLDRRFKACLNMDGFMACESLEHGAIAPLFFMSEIDPVPADGLEQLSLSKRREKALDWEQFTQARKLFSTFGGYWLTIKPSKHFNFSDYVFSSPIHFFSRSGAIDPTRAARTIDRYSFAFFELYLRGGNQPLLDELIRDSAEIRFEKVALVPERQ